MRTALVSWGLGASHLLGLCSLMPKAGIILPEGCIPPIYVLKEIFINVKSNSAKATSSPGGKSRDGAQVFLSASLPPGLRSPSPPNPAFKPFYLEGSHDAFSSRSQLTINFQPN